MDISIKSSGKDFNSINLLEPDLESLCKLSLEAVGCGEDPGAADQGAATPDKPGA